MAASKKPRRKYDPLRMSRGHLDRTMHEVWFAGGMCLKEVAAGGVYDNQHSQYVLSKPRQWTVMVLAFCENETERYTKVKIERLPGYLGQAEIERIVPPMYTELADQQNQSHLISWGWFMVPSHAVDLESMKSQIIDRFELWGAFDRAVCNLAWAMRQEEYAEAD